MLYARKRIHSRKKMNEAMMDPTKVTNATDIALGHLLSEHNVALSLVCIASLVIGFPLAVNLLWHLQVHKCPHN